MMELTKEEHVKNLNGKHGFTHLTAFDKENPSFGLWYCLECLKQVYHNKGD